MYTIKNTETALEVRSKTAMGFVWTVLFLIILIVSLYVSFEYVSLKCERSLTQATTTSGNKNKKSIKNTSEIFCYITYFSFKEGVKRDSVLLSEILRMDKGYYSLTHEANFIVHCNPTFITLKQEHYPLRRISDITFTREEVISENFNDFLKNKKSSLNIWDWYMGYWGVSAGVSFLGLLFLSVSGRYQVARFDKEKHTFSIKNYSLLGFVEKNGNWKDIKKIIYQDKKTRHKKGIFFLVKKKLNPSDKKYKTEKVYFTHHIDKVSKDVAQQIADLIRPIAKPKSEKNKSVEQEI
ncbi:hypothetical protein Fleli_3511 [Bernardetia litoralis DSM 6794]|uniref:Uncharacterized protein n=1 Tax=Bernardetia litoralis (strain ATCC 23117 / DSM 6794 / NBRC 15988 / NCIMB 1366 / Fx l1 / Sio-4) TaxID=880071 RepID=I4APE6_BERLS|nr:hypothetical protein [Bernardetia litoralis]AFM05831.1 hypothetical protein Fleli_3511 [Bernardetia litoralis DSM 6794]